VHKRRDIIVKKWCPYSTI